MIRPATIHRSLHGFLSMSLLPAALTDETRAELIRRGVRFGDFVPNRRYVRATLPDGWTKEIDPDDAAQAIVRDEHDQVVLYIEYGAFAHRLRMPEPGTQAA